MNHEELVDELEHLEKQLAGLKLEMEEAIREYRDCENQIYDIKKELDKVEWIRTK